MYNPMLSQAAGIITLILMMSSYLFRRKSSYLLCQTSGIGAMFFSYLFSNEFFAMIALTVSLSRTLVFFLYERNDKKAPLTLSFLFAGLTVCAYVAVNYCILQTAKPVDALYLIAQILYAFIFRIRSLRLVRYTVIIPHTLAILYNLLLDNMVYVAMSYSFELLADIYSLFRNKRTPIAPQKA